jgi:hypothetical protein
MIAECGMNLYGEKSNKKRLKKPELSRQVKISLVAHFDPFQASDITADKNIFTMRFCIKIKKEGRVVIVSVGC